MDDSKKSKMTTANNSPAKVVPEQKKRKCGKCTLCCDFNGIIEIDKADWLPCPNLCYRGCRVYKSRPSSCQRYFCLWALGGLPKAMSPEATHVVVEVRNNDVLKEEVLWLKARDRQHFENFEPFVHHHIHENMAVVFLATPAGRHVRGPKEKIDALKEYVRDVAGGGALRGV